MSFFSGVDRKKENAVDNVPLKKYSGDQTHHDELDELINGKKITEKMPDQVVAGANRVTVIVTTPEKWGGSLTSTPGHCGVVLWNNATREFQSCGIRTDGKGHGFFQPESVNAPTSIIKPDKNYKIWYFTADCDKATYGKMQKRISHLYTTSEDGTKIGYAKFLAIRAADHSFSCVTAADTILAAGGASWSVGLASQTSTPYAYAQTFTKFGWYISSAAGHRHC